MDSQMDHKERKHSLYRFFASPAPRYWFVLSHRYIGIELQQYLASIPELNDPILQKDYFKSYKFSKYLIHAKDMIKA